MQFKKKLFSSHTWVLPIDVVLEYKISNNIEPCQTKYKAKNRSIAVRCNR